MPIELKPHPAQAQHPVTGDPLFDDDGVPRPLLPEQRSIVWDGIYIGYASKHGIRFTIENSEVPEWLQIECQDLVAAEFGDCPSVSALSDSVAEDLE